MLRLLTVTLNPALDQVYETPGFRVGELNRPSTKTTTAGGKGLNVARAYRALGGDAFATGFAGGRTGREIVELAESEGIPTGFVTITAEARTNVKISDPVTGTQTELNEAGPTVTVAEYYALVERVRELLPQFDVVVLSGSVPPGVPTDVYRTLVQIAQDDCGKSALLDASGDALRIGIEARPSIVKPNRDEARQLGVDPGRWQDAAPEIQSKFGVPTVLVTAGADGATLQTEAGRWFAGAPSITVKSAVGSGDSLTAGFLSGWSTVNAPEALRLGIAAGAVNAESLRSGDISAQRVRELAERVSVTGF